VKLGFILEPTASNSNYRVVSPMRALERRGHEVIGPSRPEQDVPLRALLGCDLVHCYRRLDRIPDLKQLSARGVAISFDNDDYLAGIDISSKDSGGNISGARGRFSNIRKFNDILKIARAADLATTPSEALAARYRAAGAENVAVIENYLDPDIMPGFGTSVRHEGIVLGWIAAKEHEADLPHLSVTETIATLLDRHADLRVLTVGSRLPLDSDRYKHQKPIPFDELVRVCGRIDIGIAPLADTEFNRARSNVKLKEYAAGGAVWLASAVGPYLAMGSREGGRLVADDDWLDALDALIRGRLKRRRLARQAVRWAKSQTIDRHVEIWEEAFAGAIDRARTRMAAPRARSAR
jgi:hypothetical protein